MGKRAKTSSLCGALRSERVQRLTQRSDHLRRDSMDTKRHELIAVGGLQPLGVHRLSRTGDSWRPVNKESYINMTMLNLSRFVCFAAHLKSGLVADDLG